MKRKLFILPIALIGTIMLISSAGLPKDALKISIDGTSYLLDPSPVMINDRVYVPVRSFCEKTGMSVEWDDGTNTVIVDTESKGVLVNGEPETVSTEIIPDEETAVGIGKIILEKYLGKEVEYETEDKSFYLKADRFGDLWHISQTFSYKDGRGWAAGGLSSYGVVLDVRTGRVVKISSVSQLEKLP